MLSIHQLRRTASVCQLKNKQHRFSNHGAREMELSSLDGGTGGEHNGEGFVEISNMIAMQNMFSLEQKPVDRIQRNII